MPEKLSNYFLRSPLDTATDGQLKMAKRARGKNSKGNDNQKAYINNFEFEGARTKNEKTARNFFILGRRHEYIFYIFGRGIHALNGILARGISEFKFVYFKVVAAEP